jgi:hypothetical protein
MTFKKRQLSKVPESKKIHAYVCTPAYDGKVETGFAQALAEVSYCCPLYGIQITAGVMSNGAFIDLARNVFVKKFLEDYTDTTHLFFVDADIKFQPNAFIGLLQADRPVSCGLYRRRQEPEEYPFRAVENPDGGGLWFVDDWLQCDRVPTGFLCIRRDVIEDMAKDAPRIRVHPTGEIPWLFHPKFQDEGGLAKIIEKYNLSPEFVKDYGGWIPSEGAKFVGEDYGWCDDFIERYQKKYGGPIAAWSNFDFVHGGHKGNLFEWMTEQKQQHDGVIPIETSKAA